MPIARRLRNSAYGRRKIHKDANCRRAKNPRNSSVTRGGNLDERKVGDYRAGIEDGLIRHMCM